MNALIDVPGLARLVGTPSPPTILDSRWALGGPPGLDDYRRGHLPGACFVDLDRDLAGPPGASGRHPMPDPEPFQLAMRRCGVRAGHLVVVYDAGTSMAAARAWWLLRYFGHPAVRVLDGGYAAWVTAGLAVTTVEPRPAAGDFAADAGHLPILDPEAAAMLPERGVLLDGRAPARYAGEIEPVDRVAGHIPGARSLPSDGNLRPDGRFLEPERLRARFSACGAVDGVEIGAYCGSGVTAANTILALDVIGLRGALYVGSWSEWISDPGRTVATGPEP